VRAEAPGTLEIPGNRESVHQVAGVEVFPNKQEGGDVY